MIEPVESTFRARMKELAHRGGAATKRRHGYDPRYYRDIGRRGGQASVAARKARFAAELNALKPCEGPIVEPLATLAEAPINSHATACSPITITDVLADRDRFGPHKPAVSERKRILDAIAEEYMARILAGVREAPEPEPWDPWS